MTTLFTNIKGLVGAYTTNKVPSILAGADQAQLPVIHDAWLLVTDGVIAGFGSMADGYHHHAAAMAHTTEVIDASGQFLLPGFVDSHTHLVFAGSREAEFEMRIQGLTYQQIAEKGGGILNSARAMASATEDELLEAAAYRLASLVKKGTVAIEIKSGYGLSYEAERKMLRVARRLAQLFPITIKTTFLGAHAVPKSYPDSDAYLADVLEWLPRLHAEGLVDYVDVFCEDRYFSPTQADAIMKAGAALGLPAKIHGNQLAVSGGVQVAVANGALTVDHLEQITDVEIEVLKGGKTLPVLLPGCSFFIGIPYGPARRLLDAGLPVVLASDYNPGSCPSGNIPFLLSLATTQLKMSTAEAINAVTVNGAAALELNQSHGSIAVGRPANLILTAPMPSLSFLPYAFGQGAELIDKVMLNGEWFNEADVLAQLG